VNDILASLLAQAPKQAPQEFNPILMFGLPLFILVFYVVVLSGSRKQKKERQVMLSTVKKNDRVLTIGGIIGTVVNVRDTEVTLKVDETNNVKLTVVRGAIQKVLGEGEATPESP